MEFMFEDILRNNEAPNKGGAGDAGKAPRLQVGHDRPGAPDLIRSPETETCDGRFSPASFLNVS